MITKTLDSETRRFLLSAQQSEITEYFVYHRLARITKDPNNKKILERIANEERGHYDFWARYTGKTVKPNRWKLFKFFWVARIFGLTFGVKLMEQGENDAQLNYDTIIDTIPEAGGIKADEERHENQLLNMIEEEKLNYVGSIVLGLNDALVELTGALAGLTFALQNTRLIALAGFITGVAASFSMAASEYLSSRADGDKDALTSSIYTGIAYIITVLLLISPYFFFHNYIYCLVATLIIALSIIFCFNFYISVAKDYNFAKRFWEMAFLSMGVAALSFGIGVVARTWFGIEV
ncbi:VIT1/CCC1 transporter family protein [Candidatus Gracilibacteria bacterium]|nr:VIT1/CCC1 transporter family protein [Candidatus Gracilibacteria bacterium]